VQTSTGGASTILPKDIPTVGVLMVVESAVLHIALKSPRDSVWLGCVNVRAIALFLCASAEPNDNN